MENSPVDHYDVVGLEVYPDSGYHQWRSQYFSEGEAIVTTQL